MYEIEDQFQKIVNEFPEVNTFVYSFKDSDEIKTIDMRSFKIIQQSEDQINLTPEEIQKIQDSDSYKQIYIPVKLPEQTERRNTTEESVGK